MRLSHTTRYCQRPLALETVHCISRSEPWLETPVPPMPSDMGEHLNQGFAARKDREGDHLRVPLALTSREC